VTPEEHLAEVVASFGAAPPRVRELAVGAVRHLHAFVAETVLSRAEWLAGIELLTRVGQACTDVRQEHILLSDVLGVSMLVEMLEQGVEDGVTEPTVLGPFYVAGSPERAFGASIVEHDSGGEPLTVQGTVRSLDGQPVAGARVDVWQTAATGLYAVQDTSQPPGNLRGVFTTDAAGAFRFETERPVDYTIPDDGPVGEILRATGRHNWRPAHIHLIVSAPGHRAVSTHVFDAASEHLGDDAVFGVRDSLVVSMDGAEARFDVVLAPLA
jgi:protocatechuate 3,4-dioxygenase beta subunit